MPRIRPGTATPPSSPLPSTPSSPARAPTGAAPTSPAGWNDFNGGPPPKANIVGFGSPLMNQSGLLDFEWDKPGDKIPFELTVDVQGDANRVKAELWTNANHNANPSDYQAVPMTIARREGNKVIFRTELPIDKIGNYKATGRISTDNGVSFQWAGQKGIGDVRFRPRDEKHDALNIDLVNVGMANFNPINGRYGTFADMMESGSPETNGKYTLEFLKSQGVNAVWLQPIFEIEKWDKRHPMDDAGSPYATKDFFSVRTELSRAALGKEGEEARQAALAEFKAFKKKADELGIKVILDVAMNHVGHNYTFADLFVRYDNAGKEIREVRRNDFSQVAINPEQLKVIEKRLEDLEPKGLDYMEYVAPFMYGKYGDPTGAKSVNEIAAGGWFEWPDVKQLNHGRQRYGYSWWDVKPSKENDAVNAWMERILRFWSVDMGVDGFRLDHLTGMPERFLDEVLNKVQADVDEHAPGKSLFLLGEDFHTGNVTRHWLDAGQGGWFHEFRRARDPGKFESILDNPWFKDLLSTGSHDEDRFIKAFEGDHRSATRALCLLQLLGGPALSVMGDEFGEQQQLRFKQYKGVASFRSQNDVTKSIAKWKGRAGQARLSSEALKDNNRAWLRPMGGGRDPSILAASRWPDAKSGRVGVVFASFDSGASRSNVFRLDREAAKRIDPNRTYQAVDLMADNPNAGLWQGGIKGSELLAKGVFVSLRPYQVQVLELRPVS